MPGQVQRTREPITYRMEIAGLGLGMIVLSVVLLVWAFPRIPNR